MFLQVNTYYMHELYNNENAVHYVKSKIKLTFFIWYLE